MKKPIFFYYDARTPFDPESVEAIRFSLGRSTSWEELEEVLGLLRAAVSSP